MSERPDTPPSALDWPAQHGLAGALLDELGARARRRRRRRVVAAAAGFTALLLGLVIRPPSFLATRAESGQSRVVIAQPDRRTLPDGSIAELREGAEMSLDFSAGRRRVALTRGEAHFSVVKDPARPFVVAAAGVDVRAVGTAFSVRSSPLGVEVVVTEGRVAVDPATAATPLALVTAGHLAVATPSEASVTALAPAQLAERLAWRVPRVEFSAAPLRDAIRVMNLHGTVRLTLADESLATLRISGIVRADNAEALVRLLVANYGVVATPRAEGEILLSRP